MFPAVVCKRICVVVGEGVGDVEVEDEIDGAGVVIVIEFVVWMPCPNTA